MYNQPALWHSLLERLVGCLALYLARQVEAGASCLQIFDSWVGHLTRADFADSPRPRPARADRPDPFGRAGDPVRHRHRPSHRSHRADRLRYRRRRQHHGSAAGVDPGRRSGPRLGEGDLDPALLLGPRDRLLEQADAVLAAAAGRPGHIFNLGHGVLKETDPEQAMALVDAVHQRSCR